MISLAGLKLPPATVEGHVEIWIVGACFLGDEFCARIQSIRIHLEVRQGIVVGRLEAPMAALANSRCAQQRVDYWCGVNLSSFRCVCHECSRDPRLIPPHPG